MSNQRLIETLEKILLVRKDHYAVQTIRNMVEGLFEDIGHTGYKKPSPLKPHSVQTGYQEWKEQNKP